MSIPDRDTSLRCNCPDSPWDVAIAQSVAGFAPHVIPGLIGQVTDGSCRRGPEIDETIPVPVGNDGRLGVQLTLTRCDRADLLTICHFLQATSMTAEAM